MSSIFISYRRADSAGHAGRLFDRLRQWFDEAEVFFDREGIDAGDQFPKRLEEAVGMAKVVLVLIGPDWLSSLKERASRPGVDYVRKEVALALEREPGGDGPKVIPVLLGDVAMPKLNDLPVAIQAELGGLAGLDAHEFRGKQADWDNQFVRLRNLIARQPGIPHPRFRAPAGTRKPFRTIDQSVSPHFQDPNGLLAQLRTTLEGGEAAGVARAALFGMGGVGKTQLALKYTHTYRDAYAGLWWFRAENDASLQLDAADACVEVGAPVADGELPSRAFARWLPVQPATWLLVFDNAEDPDELRQHLPEGNRHHVIITSRNPAWAGLAQPVELDAWTKVQAAAFLERRLPATTPADRLALADDLGGLPLALEQAAAYLESTGCTIADYRELLSGVDPDDLVLDEGRAATGYERSVVKTLSLAFERLSAAAGQLLRIAAFAAPEPLPERFLREARDSFPTELGTAAAKTIPWNRVISELLRFGLAERDTMSTLDGSPTTASPQEQALTMHRLTQQVVRCRLAEANLDGPMLVAVLNKACPAAPEDPATWRRFAALTPHIQRLAAFREEPWLNRRNYSWLVERLGVYLRRGPAGFAASRQYLEQAVAMDRADLGEEDPDTLTSMNNLANTNLAQGDFSGARALHERVLEVRRRVLGKEHPQTLSSMINLATTLQKQGDLSAAKELLESVVEISRRVLGQEHPTTLIAMNNLANTLKAQGDLGGARALHEHVLEISCRVRGEEDLDTLTAMNNLANTLRKQGDLSVFSHQVIQRSAAAAGTAGG